MYNRKFQQLMEYLSENSSKQMEYFRLRDKFFKENNISPEDQCFGHYDKDRLMEYISGLV